MTARAHTPQLDVPTVDFYGDTTKWPTSALLHSEPLTERSRPHAWRIRPHRHSSLCQVFWLRDGSGTGRFDAVSYELHAAAVVVVPAHCVHEFTWRQGSDGFALSIASALIQELRRDIDARHRLFKEPMVLMAGDEARSVDALFESLHAEYRGAKPMQDIMLDSLVKALAIWIARHAAPQAHNQPASRASLHFERFAKLIERHHRLQWGVSDYAKRLGITAPHLNAICRSSSGASALQLIHDRSILAARRELTYTDKSIAEIAAVLGFTEPSYFTRFFKRKLGMTPKTYRRRSGTQAG